jgi:hypothetical protein
MHAEARALGRTHDRPWLSVVSLRMGSVGFGLIPHLTQLLDCGMAGVQAALRESRCFYGLGTEWGKNLCTEEQHRLMATMSSQNTRTGQGI